MASIWKWFSDLCGDSDAPNPGPFDEINNDANQILHWEATEGLSFNFNAPLSEKFSMGSAVDLGKKNAPGQFAFNANYMSNNFGLVSRSTPSNGRVFARVFMNHTPTVSSKIMADVGPEPGTSRCSGDLDYRALHSSSQLKLLPGRLVGLSHLHALSKKWAVGIEALVQPQSGFAAFTLATKYSSPDHIASLTLSSFGPLNATYIRRISPKVSFATDLVIDSRTLMSQATFGYHFDLSRAAVTGNVDTAGKVSVMLEERINPAFAFTLTGELDHKKNEQSFGIGVNIGGG